MRGNERKLKTVNSTSETFFKGKKKIKRFVSSCFIACCFPLIETVNSHFSSKSANFSFSGSSTLLQSSDISRRNGSAAVVAFCNNSPTCKCTILVSINSRTFSTSEFPPLFWNAELICWNGFLFASLRKFIKIGYLDFTTLIWIYRSLTYVIILCAVADQKRCHNLRSFMFQKCHFQYLMESVRQLIKSILDQANWISKSNIVKLFVFYIFRTFNTLINFHIVYKYVPLIILILHGQSKIH